MKIQRIKIGENRFSWLILGDNYLPIKPIQEFIRYLENVERLPQHERQLKETIDVIDTAKKYGWQRQVNMNQEIKINLETIIATLKRQKS